MRDILLQQLAYCVHLLLGYVVLRDSKMLQ